MGHDLRNDIQRIRNVHLEDSKDFECAWDRVRPVSQKDLFKESIEERYKAFRLSKEGKAFWEYFLNRCHNRIIADRKYASAKGITEEIREHEIFLVGNEFRQFKISNDFTAHLAREFMEKFSGHESVPEGFFRLNKLKAR